MDSNPSPASRELPLHKGAFVCVFFHFVPQRKQRENLRLQHRKQQKIESRALSLSRSATAPSRREPLNCAFFHFVPQRKQRGNLRLQHRKQQKNAGLALSLSRSVPAPSRREPMTVRVFFCAAKKVKGRKQDFQTKIGGFLPPRVGRKAREQKLPLLPKTKDKKRNRQTRAFTRVCKFRFLIFRCKNPYTPPAPPYPAPPR